MLRRCDIMVFLSYKTVTLLQFDVMTDSELQKPTRTLAVFGEHSDLLTTFLTKTYVISLHLTYGYKQQKIAQKPASTLTVLGDHLDFLGTFLTKTYVVLMHVTNVTEDILKTFKRN